MMGFRKKPGNKEQQKPQKKKWEEELEDQENEDGSMNIEINKAELAKLTKSDDEDNDDNENKKISEENKKEENTLGITFKEKIDEEKEEEEDEKEKSLAWMSSEDEAIAKEVVEDEAKDDNQGNLEGNKNEADRDSRTIFVSNIPLKAEDEEIKMFFAQDIDVPRNEGARVNKGRAFIEFATVEDATKALEANGVKFDGCFLNITQGLNNATTNLASSTNKQPVMMTFTNVIQEEKGQILTQKNQEEEENSIEIEKASEDDEEAEEEESEEQEDENDDSQKDGDANSKESGSDSDDNSNKKHEKKRGAKNKKNQEEDYSKVHRERSRSREKDSNKKADNLNLQDNQDPEARYSKMPSKKVR